MSKHHGDKRDEDVPWHIEAGRGFAWGDHIAICYGSGGGGNCVMHAWETPERRATFEHIVAVHNSALSHARENVLVVDDGNIGIEATRKLLEGDTHEQAPDVIGGTPHERELVRQHLTRPTTEDIGELADVLMGSLKEAGYVIGLAAALHVANAVRYRSARSTTRQNIDADEDTNLVCPPEAESDSGHFDAAGYDKNDCAGCGLSKDVHFPRAIHEAFIAKMEVGKYEYERGPRQQARWWFRHGYEARSAASATPRFTAISRAGLNVTITFTKMEDAHDFLQTVSRNNRADGSAQS